jgi:hypothetical protein
VPSPESDLLSELDVARCKSTEGGEAKSLGSGKVLPQQPQMMFCIIFSCTCMLIAGIADTALTALHGSGSVVLYKPLTIEGHGLPFSSTYPYLPIK